MEILNSLSFPTIVPFVINSRNYSEGKSEWREDHRVFFLTYETRGNGFTEGGLESVLKSIISLATSTDKDTRYSPSSVCQFFPRGGSRGYAKGSFLGQCDRIY